MAEGHLGLQRCRLALEEFDRPDNRLIEPHLQAGGGCSGEGILPARAAVLANRFQQEYGLGIRPLDEGEHAIRQSSRESGPGASPSS